MEQKMNPFHSKETRIFEAIRLKEQGNKHFKEKNYSEALKNYAKVFIYINNLAHQSDEVFKYAKNNNDTILDDKEKEQVDMLKYTTLLNMSQIDLYNKNYQKAIKRTTESLKIYPTAKGYFRRACAEIELGYLDEAENDLKKVLEFNSDDTSGGNNNHEEAYAKLKLIKEKHRLTELKLKEKLKTMFIN